MCTHRRFWQPGRDCFRRGNPRQYHVHLTQCGSQFWDDHITFRNFLRTHADPAQQYALLKFALAAEFPNDRTQYIEGKTEFVTATLAKARSEAQLSSSGMTKREKNRASRQKYAPCPILIH